MATVEMGSPPETGRRKLESRYLGTDRETERADFGFATTISGACASKLQHDEFSGNHARSSPSVSSQEAVEKGKAES
jgi:hypothetical protein